MWICLHNLHQNCWKSCDQWIIYIYIYICVCVYTQTLNVWYVYLHLPPKWPKCTWIYHTLSVWDIYIWVNHDNSPTQIFNSIFGVSDSHSKTSTSTFNRWGNRFGHLYFAQILRSTSIKIIVPKCWMIKISTDNNSRLGEKKQLLLS